MGASASVPGHLEPLNLSLVLPRTAGAVTPFNSSHLLLGGSMLRTLYPLWPCLGVHGHSGWGAAAGAAVGGSACLEGLPEASAE